MRTSRTTAPRTGALDPPEDELAIRVSGLRKSYAGHPAVDGIDLEVRGGEVFALLGPNGAGKTTTVEVLEGYRDRDGGEVSVLGVDPASGDRAWRSRIGIVLQTAKDLGELTVQEVLAHFAVFYPDARRPDEVMDMVGLTDKRRSRVRQLSGGDEAEHLADRVAVIAAGRIIDVAPPALVGGRAAANATVSWREDGRPTSIDTPVPSAMVCSLSERFGGEVPGLAVRRPTLEDVYLQMIAAAQPASEEEGALR